MVKQSKDMTICSMVSSKEEYLLQETTIDEYMRCRLMGSCH